MNRILMLRIRSAELNCLSQKPQLQRRSLLFDYALSFKDKESIFRGGYNCRIQKPQPFDQVLNFGACPIMRTFMNARANLKLPKITEIIIDSLLERAVKPLSHKSISFTSVLKDDASLVCCQDVVRNLAMPSGCAKCVFQTSELMIEQRQPLVDECLLAENLQAND